MLSKDMKQTFQRQLSQTVLSYLQKKSLRKRIHEKAKKTSVCPYCGEVNGKQWITSSLTHLSLRTGVVLKCALLKIAHDKYRAQKRQHHSLNDINDVFNSAKQGNAEVATLTNSYMEILNPVRVLELFERIPTEVS